MPTAIRPGIFDESVIDQTIPIETEDAYQMVRRLGREEGLFVGISAGAAAAAAIRLAELLESGTVVTIFPDAGYKYLSDKVLWGIQEKPSSPAKSDGG